MLSFPRELEEAAFVDGASLMKILVRIVVPSIKPILITQGSKDGFYEKQLKETTFLKNAEEARNNIRYQMKEGYDHSYFFISTFLEEHFAFHLSHL